MYPVKDEDSKEERAEKARLERLYVHAMVLHIGIGCLEEFDLDPWSPPVVSSVVFDSRFLTLVTSEAVNEPARPSREEGDLLETAVSRGSSA